ncbi:hypothetical protein BpHYR1_050298 [Brachionus plicatilis]|uniref:Uncharacterized protein n=1 Tax=Brachionus plicatilis TaxID=10195 RepID=A0A3M7R3S9_BRAPC|nr:hypothetical protein BpHYR1_050298 [Brachionus plicatilis]
MSHLSLAKTICSQSSSCSMLIELAVWLDERSLAAMNMHVVPSSCKCRFETACRLRNRSKMFMAVMNTSASWF